MKGRNTVCITIRLEDSVVKSLAEKAIKAGLKTPGEYIKAQILKSHSDITIEKLVITTDETKRSEITKEKPVSVVPSLRPRQYNIPKKAQHMSKSALKKLEKSGLKVDGNRVSLDKAI